MKTALANKGFIILLLRGLLGGALGGFFLVAALLFFQFEKVISNYGEWLFLGFLMFGLPCGAFVGSVVAVTTWLIHNNTAVNLGPLARATIGTLTAMIFWALSSKLMNMPEYASSSSWHRQLVGLFLFGAVTGGVAGIIVGRQTSGDKASTAQPPGFSDSK